MNAESKMQKTGVNIVRAIEFPLRRIIHCGENVNVKLTFLIQMSTGLMFV